MKDNLQNISFDRVLMRVKDVVTIAAILFTWMAGAWFGIRWVVRLLDRFERMENIQTELKIEITDLKLRIKNETGRPT